MNSPDVPLRQIAFAVAYRMLGDSVDAEDIAQECYLKFSLLQSDKIRSQQAFIAKTSARASRNFLRARHIRRTHANQISLPLPCLAADTITADARLDLSYGIVLLTQTMTPLSQAVFILRTAFDLSFSEIGNALERTPPACRQAFNRGKKKIANQNIEAPKKSVSSEMIGKLPKQIIAGDVGEIIKLLAVDVVFYSDGGGIAPDIGKPISGVSSWMFSNRKVRLLLKKRSNALPDFMASRKRRVVILQKNGLSCVRKKPNRSLMIWKHGCMRSCPKSPESRRWQERSDMRSAGC